MAAKVAASEHPFLTLLEATVIAADPETAAERERVAATERFAKVGRSNEHGQKTLCVKTSAAEMIGIDATIGYLADAMRTLGDPDPLDLRRTKAVLLLANPVQALTLIQALATRTRQDGSAEDRYADDDVPLPDDGATGPEPGDEPAPGCSGGSGRARCRRAPAVAARGRGTRRRSGRCSPRSRCTSTSTVPRSLVTTARESPAGRAKAR